MTVARCSASVMVGAGPSTHWLGAAGPSTVPTAPQLLRQVARSVGEASRSQVAWQAAICCCCCA